MEGSMIYVSSRNNSADISRCLANYMIILMHASAALQYCNTDGLEYNAWTFICGCLTQTALPALFLISGYLLFKNYSFKTYPQKMLRRTKRLFVPYVVWNITFVLFFLTCKSFVPRLSARVSSFGLDTLEGAISKILDFTVHPIDGPLWFLRTLFVLSLLSPLLFLLLKSNKSVIRYSGFVFIGLLYWACYHTGIMNSLLMTYPLYSLTLFYIGGLMATKENDRYSLNFKSNWWMVPSIIGLALNTLVLFSPLQAESPLYATFSDVGKLLLTPGLFYVVSKMNQEKLIINKVFAYAKDLSFFAYAGHFLFCSMIMHTSASYLSFMDNGKATILILLFCVVGVPVMAGIYWFGKKYAPHTMKLYDGTL